MSEPINLNKARKLKARADAQSKAAENRVSFGRTKDEKRVAKALADKAARQVEAHKRDT